MSRLKPRAESHANAEGWGLKGSMRSASSGIPPPRCMVDAALEMERTRTSRTRGFWLTCCGLGKSRMPTVLVEFSGCGSEDIGRCPS